LAVIAGELVRNGLKHAFPDRSGALKVSLSAADGRVRLAVRDDGVGLDATETSADGFGVVLVELLARQLRGEFELAAATPGVEAVVRFPQAC
jgi:two-component sensor histidine kinase